MFYRANPSKYECQLPEYEKDILTRSYRKVVLLKLPSDLYLFFRKRNRDEVLYILGFVQYTINTKKYIY